MDPKDERLFCYHFLEGKLARSTEILNAYTFNNPFVRYFSIDEHNHIPCTQEMSSGIFIETLFVEASLETSEIFTSSGLIKYIMTELRKANKKAPSSNYKNMIRINSGNICTSFRTVPSTFSVCNKNINCYYCCYFVTL